MNLWHEVTSAFLPVLFASLMGIVAWLFVQVLELKKSVTEHEMRLQRKKERLDRMDIDLKDNVLTMREELRRHAEQQRLFLTDLKADLNARIGELAQEVRELLREDFQNRNPRNRS